MSGETGAPVAGASVEVAGRRYTTDAGGRVVLEAQPAAAVVVTAAGFLPRETVPDAAPLSLWPRTSPVGIDETFTARLVYACDTAACGSGGTPLARLLASEAVLVPSAELQMEAAASAALEQAASLLTAALAGHAAYHVGASAPAGSVRIDARVDAEDRDVLALDAAAVTRRVLGSHGEVVSASITFRSLALARLVPLDLHELGHTAGFNHSPNVQDVMWNGPELYSRQDLSQRERLGLALMLQRRPGNRYPDHDAGLAAQSAGSVTVLACGRP